MKWNYSIHDFSIIIYYRKNRYYLISGIGDYSLEWFNDSIDFDWRVSNDKKADKDLLSEDELTAPNIDL